MTDVARTSRGRRATLAAVLPAEASAFTLEAYFDAASPNLVAPIGTPGFVAYTPTLVAVPEPGTLALVAAGFTGGGAAGRRRRRDCS